MVAYTPSGTTVPTASFNGTKSFNSVGWVAGGGMEWGLYGPWSRGFRVFVGTPRQGIGHVPQRTQGIAPRQWEAFAGLQAENTNNGFTSNVFRIGVSYYRLLVA